MSKLSSVKMESIEFAKRHFNGSNDYNEDDEEDMIAQQYENLRNSGNEKPLSGNDSSQNQVKTDLSFEEDLACFPISQQSEIPKTNNQEESFR